MKLRYTLLSLTFTLILLSAAAYAADDTGVYSVAISPPGGQLSVIGKKGEFVLMDHSTSRSEQFLTFQKEHAILQAAAFSPESQFLAFGTSDFSILLYETSELWIAAEMSSEKPPDFILNEHADEVKAIAFSHDGKMLASGDEEGNLKLSPVPTATLKKQSFTLLTDKPRGAIYVITFSPDGKILAAGREDATVTLWDIETRQVLSSYEAGRFNVTAVAFSPDGKTLAAGTSGSELTLWDVSRHKELPPLKGHDSKAGAIKALAFSPNGKILASGAADKKVLLWDTETRKNMGEYAVESSVLAVAFTADGGRLTVGDEAGKITRPAIADFRISPRSEEQDIVTKQTQPTSRKRATTSRFQRRATKKQTQNNTQRTAEVKKQEATAAKLYTEIPPPNSKRVHSIAFAPSTDKPTFILGQQNYFLLTTAQQQHQRLKLPNLYPGSTVVSAAFSSTLKYTLALSQEGDNLLLFHESLDDRVPAMFSADSTVNVVTYSPDSSILAVGTAKKVSTRNTGDGNLFLNQIDIPGIAKSLAFSPNSEILAVGSTHGIIELWDVFKHTHLKSLNPKSNYGAKSLAFSPNGKMLAVGRVITGEVELWNVLSEQKQGSFTNQHHGTVHSVAFSPNGKTLASGAADGKVLLWDIQTQTKIDPIQRFKQKHPKFNGTGHGENTKVLSVAFSDDGETLMSGDTTGLVLLWNLSTIDIDTGPGTDQLIASKEQSDTSKTNQQTASGNTQKKQEPEITTTVKKPEKIKPEITVNHPENVAKGRDGKIKGTVKGDRNGIQRVTIDNKEIGIALEEAKAFTYYFDTTVQLEKEGDNTFTITATDNEGRTSSEEFIIHRKPSPPVIKVISPKFTETKQDRVEIEVEVTDESDIAEVKCNNTPLRRRSAISGGGIYSETFVFLLRGPTSFRITARDTKGSAEAIESITITALVDETPVDETPPAIEIILTERKIEGEQEKFYISGTVKDAGSGIKHVKIGDDEITLNPTGYFRHTVPLREGNNTFVIIATDMEDNASPEIVESYRKPIPPKIVVEIPELDTDDSAKIPQGPFEIKVSVTDESEIEYVKCNGEAMIHLSGNNRAGVYGKDFKDPLQGKRTFKITAKDTKGASEAEKEFTITLAPVADETRPVIAIPSKKREVEAKQKDTYISGTAKDADSGIKHVKIGDKIVSNSPGYFQDTVKLKEGKNTFIITATDKADNLDTETVEIYRPPIGPKIVFIDPVPVNNTAKIATDSFTVEVEVTDESGIQHVKINGTEALSKDGGKTFSTTLYRSNVSGRVTIEATDLVGESSIESFTVNFQELQQTIGTTTPVSELNKPATSTTTFDTTTTNRSLTSTTPNRKEKDDPEITFRNTDLRKGHPHETRDALFLLRVYIIDDSQTRVEIERKISGRYEHIGGVSKIEDDKYEMSLPLNDGPNEFRITAEDEWENIERQSFTIVKRQTDNEAPTIDIFNIDNQSVNVGTSITVMQEKVRIRGRVTDVSDIQSFTIKNETVNVERDGSFEQDIHLDYGKNEVIVHAMDIHNHGSDLTFTITRRFDRTGKDFALFFPIDTYTGAKNREGHWKNLKSPIQDAEAIAENLRDNYGFKTRIFENLTKQVLLNKLYDYAEHFDNIKYTPDSQLIIYFTGHGYYHPKKEKGYLITADTNFHTIDRAMASALNHDELREAIDDITCKRVLVLLDTCDSGTFDPDFEPPPGIKGVFDNMSLLEAAIAKLSLEARWCITAAGVGYVLDGSTGSSPFASAFLNALNTKGGDDSLLTFNEIWTEIEKSKENPEYDKAIQNYAKRGVNMSHPEPRKGQFGICHEDSDFLLFPIK